MRPKREALKLATSETSQHRGAGVLPKQISVEWWIVGVIGHPLSPATATATAPAASAAGGSQQWAGGARGRARAAA